MCEMSSYLPNLLEASLGWDDGMAPNTQVMIRAQYDEMIRW